MDKWTWIEWRARAIMQYYKDVGAHEACIAAAEDWDWMNRPAPRRAA